MQNFIKSKLFKILLILTASLFGMITYEITTNKPIFIKTAIFTITKPCTNIIIDIHNEILKTFDKFFNNAKFEEENEILKKEVAKSRKKIIEYNSLKNENEQLKQALKIQEDNKNFKIEIASYNGKHPNDFYGFTINIGKNKGISEGDAVLTKNGLVGTISNSYSNHSTVSTLLSLDAKVPVIDSEKDEKGIITGSAKYSKDGLCIMKHLNKSTKCEVGDIVSTFGNSNYPENLPVGKIKEIRYEKSGMSCIAIIEPFEDVLCVKDLVIIKRPK